MAYYVCLFEQGLEHKVVQRVAGFHCVWSVVGWLIVPRWQSISIQANIVRPSVNKVTYGSPQGTPMVQSQIMMIPIKLGNINSTSLESRSWLRKIYYLFKTAEKCYKNYYVLFPFQTDWVTYGIGGAIILGLMLVNKYVLPAQLCAPAPAAAPLLPCTTNGGPIQEETPGLHSVRVDPRPGGSPVQFCTPPPPPPPRQHQTLGNFRGFSNMLAFRSNFSAPKTNWIILLL